MNFRRLDVQGLVLVEPIVHGDERGFLMETWRKDLFEKAGMDANFVLDLHSSSSYGTVRGLHYQFRDAQGKLVRVLSGEIFDVAVDIRESSPSKGQWIGEVLSSENKRALWIPPGFAHGFQVLSENANIEYKLTNYYAPDSERTILWDDPDLGISWPISDPTKCTISSRDRAGQSFRSSEF